MDVKELMQRVGENLSVGRAFGAAYEKDGLVIIPVALVAGGGGGGGSTAETSPADAAGEAGDARTGEGSGFGGVVMPVGTYVVKGDDVRWVPAVNVTLIALAALAVLRVAIRATAKAHRRHHG